MKFEDLTIENRKQIFLLLISILILSRKHALYDLKSFKFIELYFMT